MPPQNSSIYRFGVFELDARAAELRKNGMKLRLQDQPYQVLLKLIERAGEVVSREELRQTLWRDNIFVDFETGLNTAVKRLRETLGDSAENPRFVETLPRRGYRFIGHVEGIERVDPEPSENSPQTRGLSRRWKIGIAAGAVIVAIAASFFIMRARKFTGPDTLTNAQAVPLTALPGQEISPSFSPDGSQVAFGWNGENKGAGFDLYVKVIGSDKPLRLTNHPAAWLGAAWSPDGRYIAISRSAGQYSGIFLVPPTGGPERMLAAASVLAYFGTGISWSPDGKQLAFVNTRIQGGHGDLLQLYTVSIDSADTKLLSTDCPRSAEPAFSPGGEALAYICIEDFGRSSIRILKRADGSIRRPFDRSGNIGGLAWSPDDKSIVFSFTSSAGPSELWRINVSHPDRVEKLPFGRAASTTAISSAGHRLAYSEASDNINVWRLALNEMHPHVKPLITSTREELLPNISPDGRKIVFVSTRTGAQEVWACDADGTNAVQVTSFKSGNTGTPRWSPDGKQILFDSRLAGEANLYLVDANGGVPHKLETGTRSNSVGSWSSDGSFIYFEKNSSTNAASIWKIPVAGGRAVQVAAPPSFYPIGSPDGSRVYFVRNDADKTRLWQVQPNGSGETLVAGMPPLRFVDEWWPVANGIYFIADVGSRQAIEFFDFRTQRIHQVYILEKPPVPWVSGLAISPDGTWLLYSQVDESASDLMLIENFQ